MAEPMDHSGATNKAIIREHMYECSLVLKKASDMVNIEMVVSESLEQLCLPSFHVGYQRKLSSRKLDKKMSLYTDDRPITEALGLSSLLWVLPVFRLST